MKSPLGDPEQVEKIAKVKSRLANWGSEGVKVNQPRNHFLSLGEVFLSLKNLAPLSCSFCELKFLQGFLHEEF